MLAELLPSEGGAPIPLRSSPLVVGRSRSCDVILPYVFVSGRHCRLECKDAMWHVTDLDSKNGIAVDGEKCASHVLPPNSILSIASLQFELQYETNKTEQIAIPNELNAAAEQPSAKGCHGELVPCSGGNTIPLLARKVTLGRMPNCDVSLRYPWVSALHCMIEWVDGFWRVVDLGSRNGTHVNGKRCEKKYLRPGDILSIARMCFEVHYEPPQNQPFPGDDDMFAIGLLEKAGLTRIPEKRSNQ